MSALSIQPTFPIFTETDGQPLEDGYIWIGTANLDPQGNPINVYWDAGLTQLAGQPIRTQGGYPVNSGTPARLYVNSDYSIRVMNKNGSTVYSAPAATERYNSQVISVIDANKVALVGFKSQVGTVEDIADDDGSDWIGFQPAGIGAVARSAQDKMRDVVSVKDFGAIGDGIANDRIAFSDAIDYAISSGKTLHIPVGTYLVYDLTKTSFSIDAENGAVLKLSNAGTFLLNITGGNAFRWNGVTFDGDGIASSIAYTIANVNGVTMSNVSVTGFTERCCVFQQSVTNVQIVGGTYSDCTGPDVLVFKSNYNLISGCHFKDCEQHAVRFGRFSSEAAVDSGAYSTISDCTFDNVTNDTILCELSSKFITIESNQFFECRNICKITASTDDCFSISVISNTLRKPKGVVSGFTRGVSATNSDLVTVVGNVIDLANSEVGGVATVASGGIVVGTNSTVSGNIIIGPSTLGINTGDNSAVSGNTIRGLTAGATAGIITSANNAVSGNFIIGAAASGINVGNNSTVSGNTVQDFVTNGVAATTATNVSITGNVLQTSEDSARGIRSGGADTVATGNIGILTGTGTIGFSGTTGATNALVVGNNFRQAATPISASGAGSLTANNIV